MNSTDKGGSLPLANKEDFAQQYDKCGARPNYYLLIIPRVRAVFAA